MKFFKKIYIIFFLYIIPFYCFSLTLKKENFEGVYYDQQNQIYFYFHPEKANLKIPNYEFIGTINGYIKGSNENTLYGIWFLTDFKIKDNKTYLKFSNDLGSYSQNAILEEIENNKYLLTLKGKIEMTKRSGNKLIKIPTQINFIKIKKGV